MKEQSIFYEVRGGRSTPNSPDSSPGAAADPTRTAQEGRRDAACGREAPQPLPPRRRARGTPAASPSVWREGRLGRGSAASDPK
jgi:hypothetical protein